MIGVWFVGQVWFCEGLGVTRQSNKVEEKRETNIGILTDMNRSPLVL